MKNILDLNIEEWFEENHQKKLSGRRITYDQISPLFNKLPSNFKLQFLGKSYNGVPINSVKIGQGATKIMIWSQMHGNESTGTKAIFDLFNFLINPQNLIKVRDLILKNCTLLILPMLNPDGANNYTRVNAQNIDLNRDVIDKKANESKILQSVLKKFNPNYCFNLHDQRTIFSVGEDNNPATISFLAPSVDEQRTITEGRKETMRVIVSMFKLLKKVIPNNIGRYTDEFYPTATGDNFQKEGYHTILIESGHFKDDYSREISRKYTFIAVLQGLIGIANGLDCISYKPYFNIPNNEKNYLDVLIKNAVFQSKVTDIGILYKEILQDESIVFKPFIEKIETLSSYNANIKIDKKGLTFKNKEDVINYIKINT